VIRRTFLLLALCTAAAACSDSTGPDDLEGRYELRTINDIEVPATVVIQGGALTVQSGYVQLESDQSFTLSITGTTTANGSTQTQTTTQEGTWELSGGTLYLDYTDGSTDTGTIEGKELSVSAEGLTFVFRR
jgi:hypothetical protein